MHRGMADRLAALWQISAEVEAPLWQEPVQGLTRSPSMPSMDPAALDYLLCNALKVGRPGRLHLWHGSVRSAGGQCDGA